MTSDSGSSPRLAFGVVPQHQSSRSINRPGRSRPCSRTRRPWVPAPPPSWWSCGFPRRAWCPCTLDGASKQLLDCSITDGETSHKVSSFPGVGFKYWRFSLWQFGCPSSFSGVSLSVCLIESSNSDASNDFTYTLKLTLSVFLSECKYHPPTMMDYHTNNVQERLTKMATEEELTTPVMQFQVWIYSVGKYVFIQFFSFHTEH